MKTITYLLGVVLIIGCSTPPKKEINKTWLGKSVQFNRIKESVNNYEMFNAENEKVGSMSFGWYFENGMLVSRDTSQFDDGSVYETAEFFFDTTNFEMKQVAIDMKMGPTALDIDFNQSESKIEGQLVMSRDTLSRTYPADSTFAQDAFREELYMLMHTLKYAEGDSIPLTVFVPTGLTNSTQVLI